MLKSPQIWNYIFPAISSYDEKTNQYSSIDLGLKKEHKKSSHK
jgi:hypothetical protein